ncbi:hypothetical protein ACLOJK_007667 [Asimina triloba]
MEKKLRLSSSVKANKPIRSFEKEKALAAWDTIKEALAEDVETIECESEHEAQLGIYSNKISFMVIHDDQVCLNATKNSMWYIDRWMFKEHD